MAKLGEIMNKPRTTMHNRHRAYVVTFLFAISAVSTEHNLEKVVKVNKCCEPYELYVGNSCTHINRTNESAWHPIFTTEKGITNQQVQYTLVTGEPDCGSVQQWGILHYANSQDVLHLLPNGVLRHYLYNVLPDDDEDVQMESVNKKDLMYYDYEPGKYCMEKVNEFFGD